MPGEAWQMEGLSVVFDIETGPVADLEDRMPDFDPESVKLGNIRDPDKKRDKIAAAEERHRKNFIERAALSAATGQILAIGYLGVGADDEEPLIEAVPDLSEEEIIANFWRRSVRLIGFNIFNFDLPFLVRRSWLLSVVVPADIRQGRSWSTQFVDLAEIWRLGVPGEHISLNNLCLAGQIGEKNGDGAMFAETLVADREKAMEYLTNDLEMTFAAAQMLAVI